MHLCTLKEEEEKNRREPLKSRTAVVLFLGSRRSNMRMRASSCLYGLCSELLFIAMAGKRREREREKESGESMECASDGHGHLEDRYDPLRDVFLFFLSFSVLVVMALIWRRPK